MNPKGWFGRDDQELRRELALQVEKRVADLVRSGMSEGEARRRSGHGFGGIDQVREQCHDARPGRWLDRLLLDTRQSIRALAKRPVASVAAILTIAVCEAVNTAVYTVVDSLLIRPLPFRDSHRLISVTISTPRLE
ncbi:MAG: permease prefix domain 1-containing protein [Bryobacteraceae bacterium]